MAVLDVPGIEVAVQISGRDVVEYDGTDAPEHVRSCPTSSKHIESIDDAEFAIRYGYGIPYKCWLANCLLIRLSVDDEGRERVIEDSRIAKKLGLIEVEVYRSTSSSSRKPGASSVAMPRSYELAEKSLKGKAISRGVPYTPGRIMQEALKKELIIPRSPLVRVREEPPTENYPRPTGTRG
ncbi:hypothetical protein DL766_004622 [Monosporascus sp. MC13-8B]|uniref:DUF7918 domain-containing protein n=1 Tax=Monosporascus cannonballus TaxID=155416 RepID=A0ABY0H8U2_9PEZI|nr:hypothetical protein DL762_004070 [Monosporascus cannonballus]RYO90215.1 hypothetical protein DL763_005388 [Monosporascus cannonballus]RYP30971.1 hypothetical protein DL766_004622 [Monosporascus sp. MC13-8B]